LRDMGRRAMAAGWSPSSPSPLELSMGHMQGVYYSTTLLSAAFALAVRLSIVL
jgi:hypothetical protein